MKPGQTMRELVEEVECAKRASNERLKLENKLSRIQADLEAWKRLAVAHENWAASNGSPWAPISEARAELKARGLLKADEGV